MIYLQCMENWVKYCEVVKFNVLVVSYRAGHLLREKAYKTVYLIIVMIKDLPQKYSWSLFCVLPRDQ